MTDDSNNIGEGRLERLLEYLARDADNVSLLREAVEAAMAERQPQTAADLLSRLAALSPLNEHETHLGGLAALQLGDYETASAQFGLLLERHPEDPSLRFNQAWSWAMMKRFEDALGLLDDSITAAVPQAAMLQVQLMHELADFDGALERAKAHVSHHPDHPGLMAVVSVLAIDCEDMALAETCARKGGDHPDALTTLGTLALGDARDRDAAVMFDRALGANPNAPRAWVGKGLTELTAGAYADAASHIRKGAELFDSHIGSWIAAGWANLLANDIEGARDCFERAFSLDHNFGESHGSLAVIAIVEGRASDAERLTETALRLDRQSFSAALARSLLLQAQGKPELAQKIIERALHTPIDAGGATIAQAIAKRALLA
jgi:tetratricopeptide (TPR) repeat protein